VSLLAGHPTQRGCCCSSGARAIRRTHSEPTATGQDHRPPSRRRAPRGGAPARPQTGRAERTDHARAGRPGFSACDAAARRPEHTPSAAEQPHERIHRRVQARLVELDRPDSDYLRTVEELVAEDHDIAKFGRKRGRTDRSLADSSASNNPGRRGASCRSYCPGLMPPRTPEPRVSPGPLLAPLLRPQPSTWRTVFNAVNRTKLRPA
jgi:hypothetical protein